MLSELSELTGTSAQLLLWTPHALSSPDGQHRVWLEPLLSHSSMVQGMSATAVCPFPPFFPTTWHWIQQQGVGGRRDKQWQDSAPGLHNCMKTGAEWFGCLPPLFPYCWINWLELCWHASELREPSSLPIDPGMWLHPLAAILDLPMPTHTWRQEGICNSSSLGLALAPTILAWHCWWGSERLGWSKTRLQAHPTPSRPK